MKDKRRKIGFSFAINGIVSVTKSERNFRLHLIFTVFTVIMGLYFQLTTVEWAIIIVVIALVLITEVMNTVIEKMIDYLRPDTHPTAGYIKDAAAGAVLLSAISAVIIGMIIFLPKIIALL